MKTFLIFALGLTLGIYSTHYYNSSKTEYFNTLYTQYSNTHTNQLTEQQFENQWLSDFPWCFNTSTQNFCNSAAYTSNTDMSEDSNTNQLVEIHQTLIKWYPVAKNNIYRTFSQIENLIQEKLQG